MDIGGAPYAYTPLCDGNDEMDEFRFWKGGFWASHLQGKPYHISALYLVDLHRFRALAAGARASSSTPLFARLSCWLRSGTASWDGTRRGVRCKAFRLRACSIRSFSDLFVTRLHTVPYLQATTSE
eukprot:355237-Chlamydomonas_euryale.AAC.1